jgi:hypothetical protein
MRCDPPTTRSCWAYVGDVDQRVEAAGGADVEGGPERGHVLGLGGEHRLGDQPEEAPAPGGARGPAQPGVEGLAVQLLGPGRPPRVGRRDLAGDPVQAVLGLPDVGEDQRVQPGNPARVLTAGGAELADVFAVAVGGVGAQAQFPDQLHGLALGRAHPLPAHLDGGAAGQLPVEEPATDPVARVQHQYVRPVQPALGTEQSDQPCAGLEQRERGRAQVGQDAGVVGHQPERAGPGKSGRHAQPCDPGRHRDAVVRAHPLPPPAGVFRSRAAAEAPLCTARSRAGSAQSGAAYSIELRSEGQALRTDDQIAVLRLGTSLTIVAL